jgi:hypothetical protein
VRHFPYPVDLVEVHLGPGVPAIESEELHSQGVNETHGLSFQSWVGEGFGPESHLRLDWGEEAPHPPPGGRRSLLPWALSLALLLAVGSYVSAPLKREAGADPRLNGRSDGAASELRDLDRERRALLDSVKELEMDHRMGKLADEDYLPMRDELRGRAVAVMKRMDHLTGAAASGG